MVQEGIFWGLLLAWLGNGLGALSPGPNMIAVASAGLSSGRRPAVLLAAGIASGAIVWCLSLTLGLGQIFRFYPQSKLIIGLLGGMYLIYLAQKNLRSAHRARVGTAAETEELSGSQAWLRGLTINLTNPKSALFWTSIAAYFQSLGIGIFALFLFVIAVSLQSFTIYGLYGFVFSTAGFQRLFNRFAFYFEFAFGLVFLVISVILLYNVAIDLGL